jgi:hypothetical protein
MNGGLHSAPHSVTRSVVTVVRIADPHAAHAIHGRHPAPAAAIQSDRVEADKAAMPKTRTDKGDAARADMQSVDADAAIDANAATDADAAWAAEAASADRVTGTHSTTTTTAACVGFSEGDHENRRHRCGE